MDLEWALWETQKAAAFYQKAKNSLLDVCWTGDETTKATASNVAFQILSLRDDTGQKCPKTKCLIEQKIARYFSRLSALTKIGLLKRPPSVRRNSTDATKNTDLRISLFYQIYCLCPRKQLVMSCYVFVKGNLQEAYWSKHY